MPSTTFAQRLKLYLDYKNYSAHYMNKCAGITTGIIVKAVKGDKSINSKNLEQILLAFPDLNADWLLTGRGNMLHDENNIPENPETLPPDLESSIFRCIIWHILLQDTYDETLKELRYIMKRIRKAQDRITELNNRLAQVKVLLEGNFEFQPENHGIYEMALRVAAGDDGKYTPTQLKKQFNLTRALSKYIDA